MGKTNDDNHCQKLKEEDNNSNDQFWVEGDSKNLINNDFNLLHFMFYLFNFDAFFVRNLYFAKKFQELKQRKLSLKIRCPWVKPTMITTAIN